MFPTRLNLLPPDNKKYLQKMIFTEFIKNTLESMLFFLSIAAIILIGGQSVLDEYFATLADNIVAITNSQGQSNLQIKEINKILKEAKGIQDQHTLWTPIITELAMNLPDGVILLGLTMDSINGSYTFVGLAKTRDDLLDLKKKMESLSFINFLEIPPSQLTKKENIDFSLTAF